MGDARITEKREYYTLLCQVNLAYCGMTLWYGVTFNVAHVFRCHEPPRIRCRIELNRRGRHSYRWKHPLTFVLCLFICKTTVMYILIQFIAHCDVISEFLHFKWQIMCLLLLWWVGQNVHCTTFQTICFIVFLLLSFDAVCFFFSENFHKTPEFTTQLNETCTLNLIYIFMRNIS